VKQPVFSINLYQDEDNHEGLLIQHKSNICPEDMRNKKKILFQKPKTQVTF